jgi:hypothetical protein
MMSVVRGLQRVARRRAPVQPKRVLTFAFLRVPVGGVGIVSFSSGYDQSLPSRRRACPVTSVCSPQRHKASDKRISMGKMFGREYYGTFSTTKYSR